MKNKTVLKKVLAWLLIAALIGTMIISVIISSLSFGHGHVHAEEALDSYAFDIVFMEDEQALRVTQRLVFYNRTGEYLDRVMFTVYANMFRREHTVMYETADAQPYGFSPGGVEFYSVKADGKEADWAVQGDAEYFMRVECGLEPGESCEFEFVYDVLLTRNAAFIGVDQGCWRLSGFFPTLCVYNDGIWEGNAAMQHTRYTLTTPANYTATVTLPDMYELAGTGTEYRQDNGDGTSTWTVSGENIREFALTVGRAWHTYAAETGSGVEVKVLSSHRSGGKAALGYALDAVALYEEWFGEFPVKQLDIVETDLAVGKTAFAGCIWLDREVFSGDDGELRHSVRCAVAEQYFGIAVYSDPVAQAWLGVSIPEYVAYLALEELDGYDAFTGRMNLYFVDAIKITIPSNLVMNTDAILFSQSQFTNVVRHRGAMAMHELRTAMGRDEFIGALAMWYTDGRYAGMVDEFDFLKTLEKATGYDWEDFLTELIFEIDEYSLQYLDWYE